MSEKRPSSTFVQKLTLGVLVLVLSCQAVFLLTRKANSGFPPPTPKESPSYSNRNDTADPAPTGEKQTTAAQVTNVEYVTVVTNRPFVVKPTMLPPRPPLRGQEQSPDPTPSTATSGRPVAAAESPTGTAMSLFNQQPKKYVGQAIGSEMRIDGQAANKPWNITGNIINGSFEITPASSPDEKNSLLSCSISVPVRTLRGSGGPVMDNKMSKALNASQFPSIRYTMTGMTNFMQTTNASAFTFQSIGLLDIAGVTNTVSFPIVMEPAGENGLKFTGSFNTKMSDFMILPPEYSLGGVVIKPGDDIKLTWTWNTALKQ